MAAPTEAPAAKPKAEVKAPVTSTSQPVTRGAIMPAQLPSAFCTLIHLPLARGPASVWPIAYIIGALPPTPAAAMNSPQGSGSCCR